jgi:hypothetical protein
MRSIPTAQPRRTVTLSVAQRYQNAPPAIERQLRALTQGAQPVDYGRWWRKTFLPGLPVHRWVEWQVAWLRQPGWLYCRELTPHRQTLLLVTDPALATAATVARLFPHVEQQPFCLELAGDDQQWTLFNAVAWPMVSCLRGVRVPAYRSTPTAAR